MAEYRQLKLYNESGLQKETNCEYVMERISAVLQLVENSIDNENVFGIILFLRKPRKRFTGNRSKMASTFSECKIKFPSLDKNESLKFTRILKTLKFIYMNLKNNKIITKRDLYYQDVETYLNKQRNADDIVDTLAYTLDVPISSLNLVPSQKGLLYITGTGKITINYSNGRSITFDKSMQAELIPSLAELQNISISPEINKILVIEKEAVFKTLAKELPGNFLLITGKGYPDRLTQDFLHRISSCEKEAPISTYGIADSDPYGINILLQYILGYSDQAKHYTSSITNNEINGCALNILGVFLMDYKSDWLNLNLRDFVFARNLLIRLNSDIETELLRTYSIKETKKSGVCVNLLKNETAMNTELVRKFNETTNSYSNTIIRIESQLEKFKVELQRQMFFFKKSEMNVIGQPESLNLNQKDTVKTSAAYSDITSYILAKIDN